MKNVILLTGSGGFTPFVDSIQSNCITFTKAHSSGPYTQAAFPGILTSSYYLEYGRQKMLSGRRVLISEVLKGAGIVTAAFHSNPYLSAYFGWDRGWDVFYDSMEEDVDEKIPYIKARDMNKKVDEWFLTNNEMYRLFKDVVLKRDVSDKGVVELLRKLYCAHVREVDEAVKEFFEILRKWKVLESSVIIITSDHGDEFGEHGGLSHDGKMYSELIEVPLFIYDPSRGEGEVCDRLVSTMDIPPTIAYLFGVDPPEVWQGHSLLPLDNYSGRGVFGEALDKRGSEEKGDEKEIVLPRMT